MQSERNVRVKIKNKFLNRGKCSNMIETSFDEWPEEDMWRKKHI